MTADSEFEVFFDANKVDVVKVAYTVAGNWDVARDAAQEAFTRLYDRWDTGEVRNPRAWVRTVAVNLVRSRRRRARAELRALARLAFNPPPRAATHVDDATAMEEFRALLSPLPDRQRRVVVLRYAAGLTVAEIAQALGVTEGTVKTQLHRARQTLSARISAKAAASEEAT